MKKRRKFVFFSLFILVTSILLTGCSKEPGKYNGFAQCLTDEGVKMYGTEWCSHCKNQKAEFGSSFDYIDYVDCDKDKSACSRAGIKGFPTWVIDGELYAGEQPLPKLADLSGCELVEDMPEENI